MEERACQMRIERERPAVQAFSKGDNNKGSIVLDLISSIQ